MSDFSNSLDAERARILAESGGGQAAPQQGEQPAPSAQPGPRPMLSMSDKLGKLQRAAEGARRRDTVYLPDLSAAYTLAEGRDPEKNPVRIEATISDIPKEALLASGTVPQGVRKLLTELITRAENLTAEHREKIGMMDLAMEIAQDGYGGDVASIAGDAIMLQWAIACMGVSGFLFDGQPNNPSIQLVMDRNSSDGLWIGTLSDRDRARLVNATWQRVEKEVDAVTPFPGTHNADEAVAPVAPQRPTAERSADI